MKTIRLGIVALVLVEALIFAAVIVWPPMRHPSYLRDAYRMRSIPPTDRDVATVQAAWDRKRKEDRKFIAVGLCLMGILAVPLIVATVKAGGLYSALWHIHDQPHSST